MKEEWTVKPTTLKLLRIMSGMIFVGEGNYETRLGELFRCGFRIHKYREYTYIRFSTPYLALGGGFVALVRSPMHPQRDRNIFVRLPH
jgi:hypothetical protein